MSITGTDEPSQIQFQIPSASDTTVGLFLGFIPVGVFRSRVIIDVWLPVALDTGETATVTLREDVAGANNILDSAVSSTVGNSMIRLTSFPVTPTALDQIRVDIAYNNTPTDGSFVGLLMIRDA